MKQNWQERGTCFVNFASAESDSSPLSLSAQLERHDPNIQNSTESAVCIDETTDQILAKLLPYLRTTIFHPSYREPPLLSSQTFCAVVESQVSRSHSIEE